MNNNNINKQCSCSSKKNSHSIIKSLIHSPFLLIHSYAHSLCIQSHIHSPRDGLLKVEKTKGFDSCPIWMGNGVPPVLRLKDELPTSFCFLFMTKAGKPFATFSFAASSKLSTALESLQKCNQGGSK